MQSKLLLNIAEEDLVAMIIAGDKEAFEFLYDKYNKAVFGLLVNITNDTKQAEILLIDCFATIHDTINSFRATESRLFTWISHLVRAKALQASKENRENKNHTGRNYVRENGESTRSAEKPILELVMFGGYSYDDLATIKGVTREEIGALIRSEINQMKKKIN